MKHNNVIPNGHFKKHWQNYVKKWFNQPARRTEEELKKAVKVFSRPTAGLLGLVVHGQTLKYNIKVRAGRGFSLEELKEFQRNRSVEGLKTNIHWLKRYKAKLVIFPRKACKTMAGDSTPEELATATQVQGEYLPITREQPNVELVKVTNEMKAFRAYGELRLERTNKQYLGARQKMAAEAEKEEKK